MVKVFFLYEAVHDIKNPLQNIIGTLNNIEDYVNQDDGRLIHDLDLIHSSTRDINEVLQLVQDNIEGSKKGLMRSRVNLMRIVDNVVLEMGSYAEKEGVDIQIDDINADNVLPPVWGNQGAFERALRNLVDNSIKYRDKDKSNPIVRIELDTDNKNVYLTVKDNGKGMSADRVTKIGRTTFDRKRSPLDSHGMGLGLYTLGRTITKYGGKIQAQSNLGEGTEITIVLPQAKIRNHTQVNTVRL